jgi:hypothetical protein
LLELVPRLDGGGKRKKSKTEEDEIVRHSVLTGFGRGLIGPEGEDLQRLRELMLEEQEKVLLMARLYSHKGTAALYLWLARLWGSDFQDFDVAEFRFSLGGDRFANYFR